MKVWMGVCVGAGEDIIRLGAKALRVGGVKAMSCGDPKNGGGDYARVCFKCASDRCNWLAVIWGLAC